MESAKVLELISKPSLTGERLVAPGYLTDITKLMDILSDVHARLDAGTTSHRTLLDEYAGALKEALMSAVCLYSDFSDKEIMEIYEAVSAL